MPKQPPRFPDLTDLGNAQRFTDQHRKRARYCPAFKSWLIYDGRRWQIDRSYAAERLAVSTVLSWPDVLQDFREAEGWADLAKSLTKHAKRSQSAGSIRATLELAKTCPGMTVAPEDLDADPWVLNCLSGTIDLRTGKVNKHSPKDLITKLAPVEYSPNARNSVWTEFLAHITGNDRQMAEFLCRSAGYFLTGVNVEKCFFLAHSLVPNTGKSTYLDALKATMGDYALTASPITWLKQPMSSANSNRGDLARLRGARLVTSSEFDEDARFDESLIKAITGGDEITVRHLFQEEFTYRPQFKLLLAANFAPRFSSNDEAMVLRTRRMPFTRAIPVLNPAVREALMQPDVAGAAILRWMVAGCLDWQKNRLPVPDAVRLSNEQYQQENDPSHGFFEQCLEFGKTPAHRISRKELREVYEQWCREEGVKYPLSPQKLGKRLKVQGCEETAARGIRFWTGVRRVSTLTQDRFGYDERSN